MIWDFIVVRDDGSAIRLHPNWSNTKVETFDAPLDWKILNFLELAKAGRAVQELLNISNQKTRKGFCGSTPAKLQIVSNRSAVAVSFSSN